MRALMESIGSVSQLDYVRVRCVVMRLHHFQDFHLSRFFGFNLYLPLCPYPGYNALGTVGYGVLLSLLSIATLILYIIR